MVDLQARIPPAFWMLSGSAVFAAMASCIKLASAHDIAVPQILFFRGSVAVLMLVAILHWQRLPMATPHWKAHARRGVAGCVGMYCYTAAIALLPLATAVTLNYLSPVILTLLLRFRHHERASLQLIASIFAGLAGIVLLLKPTYEASQWTGGLVAIASALMAAISAINIREIGHLREPPSRTVLYVSVCIALTSIPGFAFSDFSKLNPAGMGYAVAAGILATLGQFMLTLAYQNGSALLVSLLGYSQVVFTSLLGVAIWGNRPSLQSWLGMALIIASGAAAVIYSRPGGSPK